MKFFIDENVPRQLTALVQGHGHEIVPVTSGAPDTVIFEQANREQLVLITNDTDFLDTVKFPLAGSPGRIVLRVFPTSFTLQRARLDALLSALPAIDIPERLVILSAEDIVVREN